MRLFRIPLLLLLVSLLTLTACQPPSAPQQDSEQGLQTSMQTLDTQMLPNEQWQLSRAIIELSFCRNRTNEALLASEMELNGWRVTGQQTAFPPYRKEGLQALQQILADQPFLLWQRDGNVSAQRYYLVMPAEQSRGDVAEQLFPAVATLAAAKQICHTAVIDE
ncbi:hypothetical protein LG288_03620 [Idiomarina seosinensis]|uniref:hypothetical protein n=1 Tax=Idiomarina seosinensis TaxID=281739 RepID=UPI0038514DE4